MCFSCSRQISAIPAATRDKVATADDLHGAPATSAASERNVELVDNASFLRRDTTHKEDDYI
jgi:hypothetical protein